jgi:hypothetical protein
MLSGIGGSDLIPSILQQLLESTFIITMISGMLGPLIIGPMSKERQINKRKAVAIQIATEGAVTLALFAYILVALLPGSEYFPDQVNFMILMWSIETFIQIGTWVRFVRKLPVAVDVHTSN